MERVVERVVKRVVERRGVQSSGEISEETKGQSS